MPLFSRAFHGLAVSFCWLCQPEASCGAAVGCLVMGGIWIATKKNRWFRNPVNSPVEVGPLYHYLRGFIHSRWLFGISSINSTSRNGLPLFS